MHTLFGYYMHKRNFMRTTLDLPESLINEAMALTHISTKTDLIKTALQNLIQKEKIKDIKQYFGKINLDIDLDAMRSR
jgi:Arc/MetJ family transcription regulator